jgi:hypothetical protein
MRQRPLTCGHRTVRGCLSDSSSTAAASVASARAYAMDHRVRFSGQQQTDNPKEAEAS